jgi:PAS domain S-box-containing protein
MFDHPLAAAALALAVAALIVWRIAAGARAQRLALTARLTQLEQRVGERTEALAQSQARLAQTQSELATTEERYLLALRSSQDGMWEWDLDAGNVRLSPRWKCMLGFDPHELGDDLAAWRGRIHPDDRDAFERAVAAHLADPRTPLDHEMRLLHKDGSTRHVLSRGVAIRRDGGTPGRMIGVDTDVTRLRRVQAVLDAVADGTAGTHGERFFAAMVQHFARALDVDTAFVAECADRPTTRVRTLAFWSKADGLRENFEFALQGTPCQEVINEGRACFHREGLAERFPREAGYEAYLGMPIVASDGRILGHLALFNRRPLGDEVLVERVYRIFIARAAAEMERLQALARLPQPAQA